MIAQNLFRFVAARPPTTAEEEEDPRRIEDTRAAQEVVDEVEAARGPRVSLAAARERVGWAIIASQRYYLNDPGWQMLRPARARLQELADAASGEPRRGGFAAGAEQVLRDAGGDDTPQDLGTWVSSERYHELKTTLWRSYLANVLAPDQRPGDREELVAWVRLLHLLEAAVSNDERFAAVATALPQARPAVPAELFMDRPRIEAPVRRAEPEVDERERELAMRFDRLERARQELEAVGAAKRAQPLRAAPAQPEVPAEGEGPRTGVGGLPPEQLPWRLAEADLRERAELRGILEELGVPANGTIPEAVSVVEQALARTFADLAAPRLRREVTGFGRRLAVVEQPSELPRVEPEAGP